MTEPKLLRRSATLILLLCAMAWALSGCASGQPEPQNTPARMANSLTELFERVLSQDGVPDYAREVLSRAVVAGRIDPADYEEAHARYVTCLREAGIEHSYTKGTNGIYYTDPFDLGSLTLDETVEIDNRCSTDMAFIETYFSIQQNNPGLLADNRLVAIQCLQRSGFVADDYSPDQLDTDYQYSTFPFDPRDPVANQCLLSGNVRIVYT